MLDQWVLDRCWSNYELIKGDIRAVELIFNGLGGGVCSKWSPQELALAEQNILSITPYYGPWCWMNRLARQMVDELIEHIYQLLALPENTPLISSGGSMGGCAALLYCRYGQKVPIGCDVLYPVCDLIRHFRERKDVAPTMYHAFYGYPEPWDEVLKEHSPLHQADFMPCIPYLIIHGEDDAAVAIGHSEKMAAALKQQNHQVEFIRVPRMGHAVNVPFTVWQKKVDFAVSLLDDL